MTDLETVTIPARKGKAAFARRGQHIRVINTHGEQVVDTWAFNRDDLKEFLSMEHCRVATEKLFFEVGDRLVTNRRRPILTIVEDTSPGIHDTLMAACDLERYKLLGFDDHDNCQDNLRAGLGELGLAPFEVPSPWNLFMNIPVIEGRRLAVEPPVTKPGDYIELRAEMDLAVAFSACPQDVLPINGPGCNPTEAHFAVLDSA